MVDQQQPEQVQREETLAWLTEALVFHVSTAIESLAGQRPAVEAAESIAPEAPQNRRPAPLILRQSFSGISGSLWLWAEEPDWAAVGNYLQRPRGPAGEEAAMRAAYLQAMGQAFVNLTRAAATRAGRESAGGKWEEAESSGISEGEIRWYAVSLALGDTLARLYFGCEPPLIDSLTAEASAGNLKSLDRAQGLSELAFAAGAFENSKTFPLLLDVELPVSVSFGRTQLPLKDVLKLTTGSIVELNRTLGEPVEVVVNNCVIARGEVVVIDGNLGVRIQNVVSRPERLRSLH